MGWPTPESFVVRVHQDAQFTVDVPLDHAEALKFVSRVEYALEDVNVLEDVAVTEGSPRVIRAGVPVRAAMFGQGMLKFASEIHPTKLGAKLVPLPAPADSKGWAEIGADAVVTPTENGSSIAYHFTLGAQLKLPGIMRWGENALAAIIEVTAKKLLEKLSVEFPLAIQRAAERYANDLLSNAEVRED